MYRPVTDWQSPELSNPSDRIPNEAASDTGEDTPLTLADSSEGSTMPVGANDPRSASDSAASGSNAEGSTPSPEGSSGGTSTGGFDTVLGKLIVHRGLATSEELDTAHTLVRESIKSEQPKTLADVLVENKFLTTRQLDRLKNEFETKRTTEQIPGYKMKKRIGSGAMATVYLARQLSLDRLVAIKVLPKKLSSNANFIERFYKEGRAAAQLNHPNIVSAYDVGKAGDHHYFVMEFVDGETVYERIVKDHQMEEGVAIDFVRQVAEALQHAHQRGFIHRDIKPKNIMISREQTVKLADLGLARAMSDHEAAKAEAGRAYGTPYYISPEQIRGEVKIGPAADIYGLGATFYHMVTGRVPFEGKNPSAVMHKHLKADLVPPDHVNPKLSAGCAQVIEMMMAKRLTDRYERVTDLIEDLDLIRAGQPPHFAGGAIDLSQIPPTGPVEPSKTSAGTGLGMGGPAAGGRFTDNPVIVAGLVVMVLSLLANLVMLVILVGG